MRYLAGAIGAVVVAAVLYLLADALDLPEVVQVIAALLGLVAGWFAGLELADRSGTGTRRRV